MRRAVFPLLIALAAGCSTMLSTPDDVGPPPPWSAEMQPVADGANRFAFDLYAKLREGESGNLFASPFSIHTALAMAARGAEGTTRDEMTKVLHLPADPNAALAAGDLGRFYTGTGKLYQLAVANALWGQQGYPFRPQFTADLDSRFKAGLRSVDFKADPEAARGTINKWVEQRTKDRIKDLMGKGTIDTDTRLVLTNAIYFKGTWAEPFPKGATKDAPFHAAGGGKPQVPLMHRRDSYRYAETDKLQVLELPYQGNELSMVVVLPRAADGLPAVERELTADALARWLGSAQSEDVNVYLPRFKVEQAFGLADALKAMGMPSAFDAQKADFSGIVPPEHDRVFISAVVHKAFCEVNEEGTEAAAATGVGFKTAAAPVKPKEPKTFRADRPFVFLIRDAKHGTVLFLGRFAKP